MSDDPRQAAERYCLDRRLRDAGLEPESAPSPARGSTAAERAAYVETSIQQAIRRAGGAPSRLSGTTKGSGRFNVRGRGGGGAEEPEPLEPGRWVRTRSPRVAMKVRVVRLNPQHAAA